MEHLLILLAPLAVAALCGWIGYHCAHHELRYERLRVKQERQALDAEWRSLEQTQRVRAVFLDARRAMQAEAARTIYQEGGRPNDRR